MTAKRKTLKTFSFTGVNKDLPANMLDENLYSDVLNMEAFDLGMRASKGISQAFGTPLFPPEYLVFNKDPTQFYWLYASSDGIGVTDGQNHSDISPAVPISSAWPTNWTHADLNNIIILNNRINDPIWWDGVTSNLMAALPGWPTNTKAGAMRAYNNNLIAMDITDNNGVFENLLMWSNSADPGTVPTSWTPLPENDAGFNTLSDTVGSLLDGQQFRDSFMLFKEHSTYAMNYIGGQFVFAFRKLFTTSGILTANCSAEYLGNVFVLTDGDVIFTDGQAANSLIDKKMRSWLFNNIDADSYKTSFVTAFHSENQVWCCFPENGATEPTLALVWDASDNRYGIRELKPTSHIARGQVGNVAGHISWDDDSQPWDEDLTSWNQALFNPTEDALLQADRINTLLLAVNEGTTLDGQIIQTRVERTGLDFGDVEYTKYIRSVIPRIIGLTGTVLSVRIGSAKNDSDPVQWSEPGEYIVGESQQVNLTTTGRFIAVRIEGSLDQPPWIVNEILFDFDFQGRF